MNLLSIIVQAAAKLHGYCGTSYRNVALTSVNHSNPKKPFRAIILAEAGDVEIVGLDGVACVIALQAGVNPVGGIGINIAGTDATALTLIY